MISGPDNDLGNAPAEIRQLREMIDVLRAELEDGAARLLAERQRAVVQQEAIGEQARASIDAMRVGLEQEVVVRNAAVQAALVQSADEVAQLKATVEALRLALVTAREDTTAQREAGERAFRAERQQLHEMIAALRSRLEMSDAG